MLDDDYVADRVECREHAGADAERKLKAVVLHAMNDASVLHEQCNAVEQFAPNNGGRRRCHAAGGAATMPTITTLPYIQGARCWVEQTEGERLIERWINRWMDLSAIAYISINDRMNLLPPPALRA